MIKTIANQYLIHQHYKMIPGKEILWEKNQFTIYTTNVNRQTTDKLLFSYAVITGENV